MIVIRVVQERGEGAVLVVCGYRCLAAHHADPESLAGPWRFTALKARWCLFCHRCGMLLRPRSGCWLCTEASPCERWFRTAQALRFARTAVARSGGRPSRVPWSDTLWITAAQLAEGIPDGRRLAELLTPGGPG